MNLKAVCRGTLALAAVAALGAGAVQAQVAYTANTVQSLFYKEIVKDGRFYVFNNAAAPPASSSRARWASASRGSASGRTARPSSATTRRPSSCFSSSTASRRRSTGPRPPRSNIVWRDGKTRMTIGSNFYMEISNRVQVRYTHELPDDAVKLPGTANAGDARGSFRIRRAKLKFEGWFYQPWLTYEVQTNWPGLSSTNLGQYLEDANINWDVDQGQEAVHGQARPVQGALRPPGADLLGKPAARRSLAGLQRLLPRPRHRVTSGACSATNKFEYRAGSSTATA